MSFETWWNKTGSGLPGLDRLAATKKKLGTTIYSGSIKSAYEDYLNNLQGVNTGEISQGIEDAYWNKVRS
jgi:hypothetical protein